MSKEEMDKEILRIMLRLARDGFKTVYPRQVQAWLDTERSERQLRRDMARMAREGRLRRFGERGGFSLNDTSALPHPTRLRRWRRRR
ncbi:MAG: hypothetical protein BroJett018_40170 [Chloroflexota bacterium]|nr:MAG: hypothetical protein BroJett018_40170 [Chloroflexota bacterium]